MTQILNFALKIQGGGREGGTCEVLRPCHLKNLKRETGIQRVILGSRIWTDFIFFIFKSLLQLLVDSARIQSHFCEA